MRALAILAAYNEKRLISACIDNLIRQGLDVYLIDNESTDGTREIASRYSGRGLVGTETLRRNGLYCWEGILRRKAEIAASSGYDWIMHVDADEIRLPPSGYRSIYETLTDVDAQGFNAINFMEFSFVPTLESPDHDHPEFQKTMRWYYPFLPSPMHRLTLWKWQTDSVHDLVASGGHQITFPGIRPWPVSFPMRHYLFLSVRHAKEKWVDRRYSPTELNRGWHRSRAALTASDIKLQSCSGLRFYRSDSTLDATNPLTSHPVFSPLNHDNNLEAHNG